MPGMAAGPSIFKWLSFPEDRIQVHYLEWFVPEKGMTLRQYAERMGKEINEPDPVLIGVSFGGMLVQEIAKVMEVRKVIIISSVKLASELPRRMRFAKYTGLYKLLPTSLVNNVEFLAKYALGETVTGRLELYNEYLSVRDKRYIDWSIAQIINWNQDVYPDNLVHIQGEKDAVFPVTHIHDFIPVSNGTHTMILHRAKWFNENLPTIILE